MIKLIVETREQYIDYLMKRIADIKRLIAAFDLVATEHPNYTEEIAKLITIEQDHLSRYTKELDHALSD